MRAFLDEIQKKGISLEVVNGDLRFRGPKGAVNAEILSDLKRRKTEIVNFLMGAESAKHHIKKTCQSCKACASWRGSYKCFASALLDGKSGAPGSVLLKPCERWQARD